MSQMADQAVARFNDGFHCCQAVFSVFAEKRGLDRETALKISGAFGGGMARMGSVCGAVTGAYMVIGHKYGKSKVGDDEAREKTYKMVRKFNEKFKAANGSTICKELLGLDLSVPAEAAQAKEKGLFKSLCPGLVRNSVEILEEMLGDGS